MINVNLHSVTIFFSLSLLLSLMSCPSASDHSINVPKVPQLIAMMMFDSDLSGSGNRDQPPVRESVPSQVYNFESPSGVNDFVWSQGYLDDDIGDSDEELPVPVINYSEETIKPTDIKRGRHYRNRKSSIKRGSLSDLIRRLMALKGNSFPEGRITLMRFGTGRRK